MPSFFSCLIVNRYKHVDKRHGGICSQTVNNILILKNNSDSHDVRVHCHQQTLTFGSCLRVVYWFSFVVTPGKLIITKLCTPKLVPLLVL